jgi:hypothetical protein
MDGDDTDDNFPNDFDLTHFNLTTDDFLLKVGGELFFPILDRYVLNFF